MEKASPVDKEVTREKLIAISFSAPDKDTKPSTENLNCKKLDKGADRDGYEKYMSELMSISNVQAQDFESLSPTPPEK